MPLPIIEVDNLSKRYQLGQFNARSLRDEMERLFRRALGKDNGKANKAEFWALRDISLSVEPGKVTGIIGSNGAGKSTLLKILSRVTEPTSGTVRIRGRVASLLEVGTGFHPELTGRENVYLNGAILGMTRAEIKAKFDEIVDFSGVEKFLDTPVKRYSSGMYVRLAFAVAAHLEPEILIIDELLAVGDVDFQKKCLGKMRSITEMDARTVLFVSHNMPAIENLCQTAIHLRDGRIVSIGEAKEVTRNYLRTSSDESRQRLEAGNAKYIKSLRMLDNDGVDRDSFLIGDKIIFEVDLHSLELKERPRLGIFISTIEGARMVTLHTDVQQNNKWTLDGSLRVRATWNNVPLNVGTYRVGLALWNFDREEETLPACSDLKISATDVYGTGRLPDPNVQGLIVPEASWQIGVSDR